MSGAPRASFGRKATLATEYGNTPPVRANAARLGQVFMNLLINASQAIPAGGATRQTITVRTALETDRVLVSISDTGSGIAGDVRDRLFDPFFTTKPPGEGTGLGLSICQSIVTSFGGDIRVESELGKGSTFTVRLPVSRAG